MFNLFNKKEEQGRYNKGGLVKEVAVMEKQITVEDIHHEFFTASDKLISDIKEFKLSQKAVKAQRLERFGFLSTKDNIDSQAEFQKQKEML